MAKATKANPQILPTVLIGLLVAAAFVIGSMWTQLKTLKTTPPPATPTALPEEVTELTEEQWQAVLVNPAASWGSEDAAVTMVEFTDYQCPFCATYYTQAYGSIDENYIVTGKVRYLIHDLALPFHANAGPAAQAARCAGDQGEYRAYHDTLFENQGAWIELPDAVVTFKTYAGDLGLNAGEFATCYDSGKYVTAVDDDAALAAQVGANGTPTFIINGTVLVGAQPYASFENALNTALNQ